MSSPEASPFALEAASAAAPGRREVKFSLPNVDAGKFRSILDVNCRRVSYAGATSRVCSIYFDDAASSALRANLDGTSRRTKTRIRWYDTPFPEKRFFFEVKRREDDGIFKERTPILASGSLASMSFHEIVVGLARVLPARLRERLVARSEPKLMSTSARITKHWIVLSASRSTATSPSGDRAGCIRAAASPRASAA